MQNLLLFIELIIATALIIFVLLQKSEGGALGMGGGGGGGMGGLFTPRGAGDVLTRTTAVLAVMFFLVCIALNLYALHGANSNSILRDSPAPAAKPVLPAPQPAPTPAAPQLPSVPRPN